LTATRVPSFNVNKPSVVETKLLSAYWFAPLGGGWTLVFN